MSLLLTLNKFHILFWFFHVDFEEVNADWEVDIVTEIDALKLLSSNIFYVKYSVLKKNGKKKYVFDLK